MTLIAIDAHSANAEHRTGVHNYAFHLIQAMKNHQLQEGERVVLYSYQPLRGELANLPEGWESKVLAWPPRHGWMSIRVAWELRRDKPNLFFVLAQGVPRTRVPVVAVAHDIAARIVPEVYPSSELKRLLKNTRKTIALARHILTVSDATKQDLIKFYNVASDRMTTTPLAADTTVYRRLDPAHVRDVLQRYRLGPKFFLTVGRVETKKNITLLIRAFDLFKERRGNGDPYELVIVGSPGYGYGEIKAYIEASPYKEHIRELGYVEDGDVAALMNAATAYLFPSWFEGFGIPSLEAMSCGVPVMASDLPAHREVIGNAGILLRPQDPHPWAKEMTALIEDPQRRQQLIERGLVRAQQFSWNQTAQQTWDVLRGLI